MAMSYQTKDIQDVQSRLKAVLSYDGIAENEMHLHLAKVMGVSKPIAKRMLNGKHKPILRNGIKACNELNVSFSWLYFGELNQSRHYDGLRTLRIHMQSYKGYPKELSDKVMRFYFADIAGMSKARNLMNLIKDNRISYIDAISAF